MSLLPLFWLVALWCVYRFSTTADLVWLAIGAALVMLSLLAQRKLRAAAIAGVVAVVCFAAEPGGRAQVDAALAGDFGAVAIALCVLLTTAYGLLLMTGKSPRQARDLTRPVRGHHS